MYEKAHYLKWKDKIIYQNLIINYKLKNIYEFL